MLSKLRSTLVCTFALLTIAVPAHIFAQTTINVGPGQTYTTIQSGINAATAGDTVLVAPGTYYENIDFKGKAITVTSSGGAAITTIDGGNRGGVATVLFSGGETSSSIISGFTIRGGGDSIFSGASDGGIYVNGTVGYVAGPSPTIQNNIITANYCHNIDVEFASPTIRNNEISGVLQNTQGTGSQESYCIFGGAIYLGGTSNFQIGGSVVIGNTIENNLTGGSAISVDAAQDVLVMNNVIRNNYSRQSGSAFSSENTSNSVVVQNLIYDNTSTCGGAISFIGGILIANNTLADNVYVDLFSGSACTAVAQIYPDDYGISSPSAVIINNIISGSTSYPAVNCDWFDPPSLSTQPTFESNILRNTGGPFFGSYCIDVSAQDNNLTADPQFVNAAANNYHLKSASPAIDAGDNSVLQTFLAMTGFAFTKDFDGNPRVQDATHKGTAIIDMGAYEYPGVLDGNSVTETLTSSLNPSTYGDNVTFNVVLTSSTGTPTGTVQFKDGATVLGVQTVSVPGTSSYSTATLTVGTHPIAAVYEPTDLFTATTASLSQVVNGATTSTTTTLTCTPTTLSIDATSLFSAMVTSTSGTPTGSITFTDNGAALAQPALTNGDASFTYTGQTAGPHAIVAAYVPTGSYAASSASCSVTVNTLSTLPSTAILTVVPASSVFGSPVTLTATVSATNPPGPSVPTGTVTFTYNTSTNPANITLGTVNLNAGVASFTTTTLPVGEDNINCTYSGSSIYSPATCVNQPASAGPALTLSSSLNPAPALTPITFTAQLGSGNSGGTIVFAINGQNIPTTPNAYGTSIYTISTLPAGTYPITATWFASAHALAIQASLTQVVTAPIPVTDFSLTGSSITFPFDHSATGNLQLTSINGFAGNVAIACIPPFPPNYTCTLQHSSISLTSGLSTVFTYTLSPSFTASATPSHPVNRSTRIVLASLFPFTLVSLLGLSRKRRTHLRTLLSLTLLAILATTTTACGPDHFIPITTGVYPLTFTATGTDQGTSTPITHTLTINATITP
jgi:hypothetical protein